jgi:ketosteroid isomerase-like protein
MGPAMSQENVEFVCRWYASIPDVRDADPRDDRAFFDLAFGDYLDERWELRLPAGELVFRGREGLVALVAMLRGTWAEWRFEVERFLDAGDRVVVFVCVVAKCSARGAPIELSTAHVVTVRDGRIPSAQVYQDRGDALEAVGLRA